MRCQKLPGEASHIVDPLLAERLTKSETDYRRERLEQARAADFSQVSATLARRTPCYAGEDYLDFKRDWYDSVERSLEDGWWYSDAD